VVSFTPRPLYPQVKSPRYLLDRRLLVGEEIFEDGVGLGVGIIFIRYGFSFSIPF
jgi:hypothetical protein